MLNILSLDVILRFLHTYFFYIPFFCAILAFIATYLATPWLIRYLMKIDLVVKDMNKENMPLVPISGGLAVLVGFITGTMSFIFLRTFFPDATASIISEPINLMYLFAALTSIFIITLVGFLDDLVIEKSKDRSKGLRQWQKPLVTLTAAVPLMVVNAGHEAISIPFFGVQHLGILYPLLLIPIGVMGAANMVNMLGGLNGLESGLGLVYLTSLGLFAFVNGSYLASLIALMTLVPLLAFFLYNKYPAKIFPGDSLTYLLGGVIAVIAVVGNIERSALIVSIPFFIEFFLKLRSRFKAQSFGYYENGIIKSKYDRIYSLTHIFMKFNRFNEKQIVYLLILTEVFFASLIWFI